MEKRRFGPAVRLSASSSVHSGRMVAKLWTWVDNEDSQLGDGTFTSATLPQPIQPTVAWQAVAAGYSHTVALRADGILWAWGENSHGRLGIFGDAYSPQPVQPGATWRAVAAGGQHTVALRTDGTLWAWGNNHSGEIGQPPSSVPRPIPGGAVWSPRPWLSY